MKRLEGHAESSELTSETDKYSIIFTVCIPTRQQRRIIGLGQNAKQQLLVFGLMLVKPKWLSDGTRIKVTHWRICLYGMQSHCQGSTEIKLIFISIRSKSV
jgi:hypothetical protein